MHELSLALSVAEIIRPVVARQPYGTVLSAVEVEVGSLAGVEIDTFRTALDTVLKSEGYTSAKTEIDEISGQAMCLDCSTRFNTNRRNTVCPKCCSAKCLTVSGTELRVSGLRFKTTEESVS